MRKEKLPVIIRISYKARETIKKAAKKRNVSIIQHLDELLGLREIPFDEDELSTFGE